MICKKCGEEIPDDAEFCPKCGQNQKENTSSTVEDGDLLNDLGLNTEYVGEYPKKNLVIAMVLSLFAGLGHLYIKKTDDGIKLLVVTVLLWIGYHYYYFVFGPLYLLFVILCMLDVHKKTNAYNNELVKNGNPPW